MTCTCIRGFTDPQCVAHMRIGPRNPGETCFEVDGARVRGDSNMDAESMKHLKALIKASKEYSRENTQETG